METPKYSIIFVFLAVLIATGTTLFLYFTTANKPSKNTFPSINISNITSPIPTPLQPNFSFESLDNKYQIVVNNQAAVNDLANKWGVFSSGNFTSIKTQFSSKSLNENDFQANTIFSIYSDSPANKDVVSSSSFKLPDQNKVLTFAIYILPGWIANPNPINDLHITTGNADEILNYQLIYQMYWTGTIKNKPFAQQGVDGLQPWIETLKNKLGEWQSFPNGLPLRLQKK